MSKESHERGLVTEARPKYERVSSRSEERERPRPFVADAQDVARLATGLESRVRRLG